MEWSLEDPTHPPTHVLSELLQHSHRRPHIRSDGSRNRDRCVSMWSTIATVIREPPNCTLQSMSKPSGGPSDTARQRYNLPHLCSSTTLRYSLDFSTRHACTPRQGSDYLGPANSRNAVFGHAYGSPQNRFPAIENSTRNRLGSSFASLPVCVAYMATLAINTYHPSGPRINDDMQLLPATIPTLFTMKS